uniref:Transmembrane protein n=1 Tax=Panagrolaimus sp. JU765 TaxID=591449 RepID=A0AC34PY03_9BILA
MASYSGYYGYDLVASFSSYDLFLLPAIGLALVLLPNVIAMIVLCVLASKPLTRVPTEQDIEDVEEDENDVEAKNKNFLKKMKKNKGQKPAKTADGAAPIKDFAITNENVNKEDEQTVPIAPETPAAGGGASQTAASNNP